MRVLLVTHGYPPEEEAGTELYAAGGAEALAVAGHDVRVLAANPRAGGSTHRVDEVNGIRVERIWSAEAAERDGVVPLRHEQAEVVFADTMREFRPDVVHAVSLIFLSNRFVELAHEAGVPVVLSPTDFWFLCPRVHIPVGRRHPLRGRVWGLNCLAHMEAASPRWLASLARSGRLPARIRWHVRRANMLRGVLNRADLVLAPCEFVRERFVEFGADPARIEALPLGLEGEPPERPPRGPRPRIGFLGALTREKGADLLVDAFRRVGADADLVLRGHSLDPEYETDLRKAAGGDPRIRFDGPVATGRALEFLASLDLLVVPTRVHESFSRIAHEAFLAGTPVLAAAAGALPEIVEPGRNGRLFRAGDTADLAANLKTLLAPEALDALTGFPRIKTMDEHVLELVERYRRVAA